MSWNRSGEGVKCKKLKFSGKIAALHRFKKCARQMLHLRAVQSAWRSGLHETTNGIFGTGKKDLLFASLDFTRDVIAKYERIGNKYKTD